MCFERSPSTTRQKGGGGCWRLRISRHSRQDQEGSNAFGVSCLLGKPSWPYAETTVKRPTTNDSHLLRLKLTIPFSVCFAQRSRLPPSSPSGSRTQLKQAVNVKLRFGTFLPRISSGKPKALFAAALLVHACTDLGADPEQKTASTRNSPRPKTLHSTPPSTTERVSSAIKMFIFHFRLSKSDPLTEGRPEVAPAH